MRISDWSSDVCSSDLVRDLEDIKGDPHLSATGFFRRRTHPDVGAFHEIQPPVKYGAMPPRDLGFAPRVDGAGAAIRPAIEARRSGERRVGRVVVRTCISRG